jgi:hypothetical protein
VTRSAGLYSIGRAEDQVNLRRRPWYVPSSERAGRPDDGRLAEARAQSSAKNNRGASPSPRGRVWNVCATTNRRQYETSPPLPPSWASRANVTRDGQLLGVVKKAAAHRDDKKTELAAGLELSSSNERQAAAHVAHESRPGGAAGA